MFWLKISFFDYGFLSRGLKKYVAFTLSLPCRVSLNKKGTSLPCAEGSKVTIKAPHLTHTSNQPFQIVYMFGEISISVFQFTDKSNTLCMLGISYSCC